MWLLKTISLATALIIENGIAGHRGGLSEPTLRVNELGGWTRHCWPMGSVVGAGLLANAVVLLHTGRLNKCLRQQAGSYGLGVGGGLCIQPSSKPSSRWRLW